MVSVGSREPLIPGIDRPISPLDWLALFATRYRAAANWENTVWCRYCNDLVLSRETVSIDGYLKLSGSTHCLGGCGK